MNAAQRDGRACVVCERDNLPLVPVGRIGGVQVFSCCEVPARIASRLATLAASEGERVSPRGGKREGAGRKREIGGEASVSVFADLASPDDTDELAALIAEGKATSQAGAIRHLIRESAKRRKRRSR
jgi:hypothetical protein